jgi:hypothetical protein
MKTGYRFAVVFSMIILLAVNFETALAFPSLPSSFYGTVKVNGADVPEGTLVEAQINGNVVISGSVKLYEGHSVFSMNVPGDDSDTEVLDGGKEGDIISFRVGGQMADQTGVWHSGTNVSLDLSLNTNAVLVSANNSEQPVATQTVIPYAASVQATMKVPVTGEQNNKPAMPLAVPILIVVLIALLVSLCVFLFKERA